MNPYVVYDGLEGLDRWKNQGSHQGTDQRHDLQGRHSPPLLPVQALFDYEFRKQAYEHLKDRNIDKLVIMGGDGSFRALNDFFNDFEVPFAGIPATIDNDIAGTDYCLAWTLPRT